MNWVFMDNLADRTEVVPSNTIRMMAKGEEMSLATHS